jgi:predicted dehydrogenase
MAPLRFGLLGTGYWALHAHGTALTASQHANLQGVWGRDPAKADDLGRRLGAKGFTDLDQLLDQVDAVAIAVPPDVQAELAVRAARAGCHLLLDKPLALSVDGAEAVVEAVDQAGVAAIVFFTSRFRPDVERWMISAADSGPWCSAHLVHYGNIFQPGSPYGGSLWRRERGALWDIGPHALAAILPIMGRVNSVTARGGAAGSDTVHLVLTHAAPGHSPGTPPAASGGANGVEGPAAASTVSLSLTMPPAASTSQLVLYGEHGSRTRPEGNFEATEAFEVALAELAGMVARGERAHRCDVHFGLEVVRVLAAAEQALMRPAIELDY